MTTIATPEGAGVDTVEVAVVDTLLGTGSVLTGGASAVVEPTVLAVSLVTLEETTFVGSVNTGVKTVTITPLSSVGVTVIYIRGWTLRTSTTQGLDTGTGRVFCIKLELFRFEYLWLLKSLETHISACPICLVWFMFTHVSLGTVSEKRWSKKHRYQKIFFSSKV